jgi:hypothetical protein
MLCKISVDPLCRIICQSSRRLSENDEFHKSRNFPGFRAFPVLLRCPLFIGDLKLRQFFFVFFILLCDQHLLHRCPNTQAAAPFFSTPIISFAIA